MTVELMCGMCPEHVCPDPICPHALPKGSPWLPYCTVLRLQAYAWQNEATVREAAESANREFAVQLGETER